MYIFVFVFVLTYCELMYRCAHLLTLMCQFFDFLYFLENNKPGSRQKKFQLTAAVGPLKKSLKWINLNRSALSSCLK